MKDKRVLNLAKKMGEDCYLNGKDPHKNCPWPDTDDCIPYRLQFIDAYNDAKKLFETEKTNKL